MKKLLVTLALAGTLSVPSVVFSEATWYGSLRGGLHVGGGSDAQFFDGGSRWGIKGSAEVSDGLTAVYRFEHKISTADASQPAGRLAYAGLSGGFGTITVGHIWNAAYNHVGAITDKSYYFGDAGTGYRHGNAISYAFSSGAVGFQVDLAADGSKDSGKAIDKTEFGVTVGLGEIGKIALAHTSMQNYPVTSSVFDPGSLPSLNAGTPPSLNAGTPPSLNAGTPPSLNAGTPPSLTGGTPTTVTVVPGEPNTPTRTGMEQITVNPTGTTFNLELEDGAIQVVEDTRWQGTTESGTALSNLMNDLLVTGSRMYEATIQLSDGALVEPAATGTRTIPLMEVILRAPAATVGADAGTIVVSTGYTLENNVLTDNTCATADPPCVDSVVLLGTFRPTTGGTVEINQDTGVQTVVESYTLITPNTPNANVMREAMANVQFGLEVGMANMPTTVTVVPGEAAVLNPGAEPTLNPGAEPTLNPGAEPTLNPGAEPTLNAGTLPGFVNETTTMYGHKVTHVAVEFGLGGVTPYVGYSERKENDETAKSKTMHYGFSGSLGDTGVSYLVAGRNESPAGGGKMNPWLFNVSKNLGGGATVIFEHGNDDKGKSGKSRVGLHVTF